MSDYEHDDRVNFVGHDLIEVVQGDGTRWWVQPHQAGYWRAQAANDYDRATAAGGDVDDVIHILIGDPQR